ncbi:MAG: NTPase [Vulcanisaeta sp. AZ3]
MLRILITGPPGVGKTTLIRRVIDYAKSLSIEVFGFITYEVREGGRRIGFKIADVHGNREDWLAHTSLFRGGPMVGRYYVNVRAMDEVGVRAIVAAKPSSLVVVDEIGKMELMDRNFLRVLEEVVPSVHFVGTIFMAYRYNTEVRGFVERFGFRVLELNRANIDSVYSEVIKELGRSLGR